MNVTNILGGIALILFGIWLTIRKVRTFVRGQQGDLGYDAGGLVFGIGCIACGIILIAKQ
jgi:hypothetical protein